MARFYAGIGHRLVARSLFATGGQFTGDQCRCESVVDGCQNTGSHHSSVFCLLFVSGLLTCLFRVSRKHAKTICPHRFLTASQIKCNDAAGLPKKQNERGKMS